MSPLVSKVVFETKPVESEIEKINHPAHYGGKDNVYECIKVLEVWLSPEQFIGFCVGNSLKYQSRAGKKDGASREEDLAKSRFYNDYVIGFMKRHGK